MSATQPPQSTAGGIAPATPSHATDGLESGERHKPPEQHEPIGLSAARADSSRALMPDAQAGGRRGVRVWRCGCGAAYRVVGSDRHRIYWPLDAPPDQPITDGRCAVCGLALPGKQPHPRE
jgi:hypothetical protein